MFILKKKIQSCISTTVILPKAILTGFLSYGSCLPLTFKETNTPFVCEIFVCLLKKRYSRLITESFNKARLVEFSFTYTEVDIYQ